MVGRGSGDDGDGRRARSEDDPADDDETSSGTLHGKGKWHVVRAGIIFRSTMSLVLGMIVRRFYEYLLRGSCASFSAYIVRGLTPGTRRRTDLRRAAAARPFGDDSYGAAVGTVADIGGRLRAKPAMRGTFQPSTMATTWRVCRSSRPSASRQPPPASASSVNDHLSM